MNGSASVEMFPSLSSLSSLLAATILFFSDKKDILRDTTTAERGPDEEGTGLAPIGTNSNGADWSGKNIASTMAIVIAFVLGK